MRRKRESAFGRDQIHIGLQIAPTFAFANIWGGMILSGPKACRGSTKDART